jgi:hypothetical protein
MFDSYVEVKPHILIHFHSLSVVSSKPILKDTASPVRQFWTKVPSSRLGQVEASGSSWLQAHSWMASQEVLQSFLQARGLILDELLIRMRAILLLLSVSQDIFEKHMHAFLLCPERRPRIDTNRKINETELDCAHLIQSLPGTRPRYQFQRQSPDLTTGRG